MENYSRQHSKPTSVLLSLIANQFHHFPPLSADRPLFFPCICTGSIKYIHQECLTQWMRYSRKEYCELCGHKFSFTPIYSPDMPRVLPLRVVAGGLVSSIATAVKYWLHYTLVAGEYLNSVNRFLVLIIFCVF